MDKNLRDRVEGMIEKHRLECIDITCGRKSGKYPSLATALCSLFAEREIEARKQIEAYKTICEEYIPADKMDEANNKVIEICEGAAEAMGRRFCK